MAFCHKISLNLLYFNTSMTSQKINDLVSYVFVALMFAPHATKECVEACTGPVFISPAVVGFFTPFVQMDISWHGFLLQLLWAPLFILAMWGIFYLRDHNKYGKFFQVYILRWLLFFLALVILYNLFFWGGLRAFIFPSFIF